MKHTMFVLTLISLAIAWPTAQSAAPSLSDEQIAAARFAYDRVVPDSKADKPTFEAFAQQIVDRAFARLVDEYRTAQKKAAAQDVAKIDAAVCAKLDMATKELLAKALDGRAFCGVSAPLDAAVAVEAVR